MNLKNCSQNSNKNFVDHKVWINNCPVCYSLKPKFFMKVLSYNYWSCIKCEAKFLAPQHWLSSSDEYKHYLTHKNDAADPNYRKFLSKLLEPMLSKLETHYTGLDYGCGPSSALAKMFIENGYNTQLYDPFFAPNPETLIQSYHFITCSEVVEHFYHPREEFDRLNTLLKPGGWLGIMTKFQTDDDRFKNWEYRRDPTHVVFYRSRTLEIIAKQRGWYCEIPYKDVALMQKPFCE